MQRRSLLATAVVAAVAVGACSPATPLGATPTTGALASPSSSPGASGSPAPSVPPTAIKVQLSGPLDGEFAGYIAAQALGYYGDANLAVTLLPAPASGDIVQLGSATTGPEFTVSDVPEVLAAREHGSDLVDIAQIFQRSGTVMMTLKKSGITGTCDLDGLRVGLWPSPGDLEPTVAMSSCALTAGKNFTRVRVGQDASALLSGQVVAEQGETYNQVAQVLEATNPATKQQYATDDLVTYGMDEQQANVLQDGIFARSAWLKATGNDILAGDFLQAVLKGWIYCRDHQEDCVQFTVQANSSLGVTHTRWMINEVNALIWPSTSGIGDPDPVMWQRTIDVAMAGGLITNAPDAGAFDQTYLTEATGALTVAGDDLTAIDFQKLVVALAPGGK